MVLKIYDGRRLCAEVRESPVFDDDIFSRPRVKRAIRGSRKAIHMREYQQGSGDYETFSRSIECLLAFWSPRESPALKSSIIGVADICLSFGWHGSLREAMNANQGVLSLLGADVTRTVAWSAVCFVKGADWMDCVPMWKDRPGICRVIKMCFKVFDDLEQGGYTVKQVVSEYNGVAGIRKGGR